MQCPACGSNLYERTPAGWRCSACRHREPLDDLDVLAPPGSRRSPHGNVFGEERRRGWDRDAYLTMPPPRPRIGSIAVFWDIYKRNKRAALHYLTEYRFVGKQHLNRHYLAAKLCLELENLNEAKRHIDICMAHLNEAKEVKSVLALKERIDQARASLLRHALRSRRLR